jgi:hypothetical protein
MRLTISRLNEGGVGTGAANSTSENQSLKAMTPIDPATAVPPSTRSATAPPYVDEDPNIDLVQQGLDAADDEIRDTMAEVYETRALASDEQAESLDDVDFTEAEEESVAPELAAMHEEFIPSDDEEDS